MSEVTIHPALSILSLVLCTTVMSSAFAESGGGGAAVDDSADNAQLETIVVTAHRTPRELARIGSAVSEIERVLIDQRQSVFAVEVLRDLPGVAISRTSGYGSQTQVRVRGAEANQLLVMIDGVEANDPAGNDEFDFSTLTNYDIERIELVRGPQSALWGSDALAGVINVTTRRTSEPLGAGGFFEAGSADTLNGGGRFSLNGESAGVGLSASYFETEGDSAAITGTEKDGYENTTLGLNAHWQPTPESNISFNSRYTDTTTEFDDTDFNTGIPIDGDLFSDDSMLLAQLSGSLTSLQDRWENSLRLTYLDSNREQFRDGDRTNRTGAEKYGAYFQSSLGFADKAQQTLTFAIDHEAQDFSQRGDVFPWGDPNQDQQMDNTGYVLEYLTEPLRGLNLSAAVRYDDNSDFDNITTYRLTSAYRFGNSNTRLHASYGTGQKAPTFLDRYGFFPNVFIGNPDLLPETSRGFDIGVGQSFLSEQARFDLTYFNERLKDEINGFVFDFDTGTSTAENMDGTSHRRGIEAELVGQLSRSIRARASYTYTDSKQPDPADGDTREIRRPEHMAALNFNYAFADARANTNLNIAYTGKQTDTLFGNTVTLDDYTLVDLTGSFNLTSRVSLYARVENLLDEEYSNVFGYRSPGRGVYAGIRMGTGG